jgi:hypothetical protein
VSELAQTPVLEEDAEENYIARRCS